MKEESLYAELIPLKKSKSLRKDSISTFDTETRDGLKGSKILCWGFSFFERNGRAGSKITTLQGFNDDLSPIFNWVQSHKHKTHYVTTYVHNLSFDIRFIEKYCVDNDLKFRKIKSGSNIICYTIPDIKWQLIDSVQFLQDSQENAEISWEIDENLRKIDCSELFNELQKGKKITKKEEQRIIAHNKNDCEALLQIITKLRKELFDLTNVDLCSIKSASALAMKIYRTMMNEALINPFLKKCKQKEGKRGFSYEVDWERERFVRSTYFGGRTEVFNTKTINEVVYFDRNSMFPAEMESKDFPVGNPKWIRDKDELMNIIKGIDDRLGFIECIVIPDENDNYPLLPLRMNHKVLFTCCKRKWVYTIPELQQAYKSNYKIEVIRGLIYPERKNLFREYIRKFYEYRLQQKGLDKHGSQKLAKLLMNGLYGKFGQRFDRENIMHLSFKNEEEAQEYLDTVENIDELKLIEPSTNEGYWVIEFKEKSLSLKPFQNVAISSYVTAYSRINLYLEIKKLEQQKIPTLYCDTDSMSFRYEYLGLVKQSNELGGWKVEDYFNKVRFLAPKVYLIEQNYHSAKNEIIQLFRFENWFGKVKIKSKYKLDSTFKIKCKGLDKSYIKRILPQMHTFLDLEERIRCKHELDDKYMSDSMAHHKGLILAIHDNRTKQYSFISDKRQYFDDGTSKPWNDSTIPEKFMKEKPNLYTTELQYRELLIL